MSSLKRGVVCLTIVSLASLTHAQEPSVATAPLDELLSTPISTAARYEQKLTDTPAAVTVITAEEIRRYGWETLAEVLNAVRGLYVTYDRNYTYLGVRGFGRPTDSNNRLLVMIDGHSMNEHVFGSAGIGSELAVDLSEVERIEFVRGPGSVLYGSGAMFGVINVITQRTLEDNSLRVEASAGSAQRRGASVAVGKKFGDTSVRLAVNRRSTEGRDLYYREFAGAGSEGVAHDLDYDDVFGVAANVTRGEFRVNAFLSQRRKGIPTAPYDTNFDERSETWDDRRFIEASYSPRLSARTRLEVRAFHDFFKYVGDYAYASLVTDDVDGRFSGAEVRALFDLRSNHRFTLGAQYIDELSMEYGVRGSADRTRQERDRWATYAQHEYQPLENLTIVGGLRYDYEEDHGGRTTPRLAVVLHPNESTALKLLYGEAFRTPTPFERDYEAIEGGVGGYLANPDLHDESIRTSELVWEQRLSPELLAVFSAYRFTVTGLIESLFVDPGESLSQFINRGSVVSRGVEMELNHRSSRGLWSYANYALQKAEEKGERLTNSPQHILSAGVSGPLGARFDAAVEMLYESSRRTMAETETDAFLVGNLTFSARLWEGLRLVAHVRNVLDRSNVLPASKEHRQETIEQDGRTFLLRLIYRR